MGKIRARVDQLVTERVNAFFGECHTLPEQGNIAPKWPPFLEEQSRRVTASLRRTQARSVDRADHKFLPHQK